jgi:2Fe-2S type ferredoxin
LIVQAGPKRGQEGVAGFLWLLVEADVRPQDTEGVSDLTCAMATFTVQLVNKRKGLDLSIQVPDNQTIYDASLDAGLDLPYSCGTGNCSSCTGRLEEGRVEHDNQKFLTDDQLAAGFVLLCTARPLSDCRIRTHQEAYLV